MTVSIRIFRPGPGKRLKLPGLDLTPVKELITYTARGFEPYRGFPQFIAAIPRILEKRKNAHVVIVGEDRICYGPPLPPGETYKKKMMDKIPLDPERVHFVPALPYGQYRKVLQSSTVHVYLTVPFVLSWSLLEAMSCECLVVGADTPPVQEVISDGVNGVLADMNTPDHIADRVVACLEYPSFMATVKKNARQTIERKYRLSRMLDRQMKIITGVTASPHHPAPRFG